MKTYNCGAVAVLAEREPEQAKIFDSIKNVARNFIAYVGSAVIKRYVCGAAANEFYNTMRGRTARD